MNDTLENLAWDAFAKRYGNAKRKELEYYPRLKLAWEEWRDAWNGGVTAEREVWVKACTVDHPHTFARHVPVLSGNSEREKNE